MRILASYFRFSQRPFVDDLLEDRRDHNIHNVDVLCLVQTWHDTDSVCFRRLRSDGYQIIDRPRPRNESASLTLSTNYGSVAIDSVPGVRLSAITLGVNPTNYWSSCLRVSRWGRLRQSSR